MGKRVITRQNFSGLDWLFQCDFYSRDSSLSILGLSEVTKVGSLCFCYIVDERNSGVLAHIAAPTVVLTFVYFAVKFGMGLLGAMPFYFWSFTVYLMER